MSQPEPVARTLDPYSLEVLEFPAIVALLHSYLSGPISEPALEQVAPHTDLARMRRDLDLAREAREFLRDGARPSLGFLVEPSELLEKLGVEGLALEPLEILALVELARAALDVYRLLGHPSAARPARRAAPGSPPDADEHSETAANPDSAEPGGANLNGSGPTQSGPMPRALAWQATGGGSTAPGAPSHPGSAPPAAASPKPVASALPPGNFRLAELARALPDFRPLVTALSGKINPDGSLDSSASPELARLRRAIERAKLEIQSSLERLLRRFEQQDVLQDSVVTIRNDRFVIPVRSEEKRRVQGVVHGASSSGATVYIEPLETLALNNDLVELQDRENVEVLRILSEFNQLLHESQDHLRRATDILAEIDWAFAKGAFSRQFDCCTPQVGPERTICLKGLRHPLLTAATHATAHPPVPLDLEIAPPRKIIIVSGPNTGGKTVALKALGIAALMAQAGIPVPAQEARLPLFTRVLADIGDQQSIEANLSTFSAHVTNIEAMAKMVGPNDLVLLDELGSSTEPNEGAALAVAILEHFRQRGAMAMATTHHSRLKAYAAETAEVANAAMEFDEATLEPTYRLLLGLPGKSSALDIAARLGLEPSIVQQARALIDPADAEAAALVAGLHQQRAEMEAQQAALDAQKQEVEKRREQLERQFEQDRRTKLRELDTRLESTLKQYARTWEQSLDELRKQGATPKAVSKGERKATSLVREAREEWNAQVLEAIGAAPAAAEARVTRPLAIGDRVQVAGVSSPGTVTAVLPGGEVEVALGRLKMRLDQQEVQPVMTGGPAPIEPTASRPRHDDAPEEINVIGTTAEEAREAVDKFLDQAFLGGRSRVRIIHGHGKGILRRSLHEMFAHHPHVEKFELAPPHEGGAGATIVELRG